MLKTHIRTSMMEDGLALVRSPIPVLVHFFRPLVGDVLDPPTPATAHGADRE